MKALLTSTAILALTSVPAFAVLPLGSDTELFVTGEVGVEHNTNIYLTDTNEESDTIVTIAPGIEIPFGADSATQGRFTASEKIQLFASERDLNDELFNSALNVRHDGGKTTGELNAGYQQLNQNNRDTAGLPIIARRDVANAGVELEVQATAKSSIGAGFLWDSTSYKPAGFVDLESFQLPFKYYYQMTAQTDLSLGFRYKVNNLDAVLADSTEYFYSVGARGDLLPKLTGEFSIGYNQRQPDVGNSQNQVGLEADFTYGYSEKTSIMLGAKSVYGYSGSGAPYDIAGGNVGVRVAAREDLTVDGSLSYNEYNYVGSTRKDKFLSGRIGASMVYNAYVTLNASLAYNDNASNLAGSDFNALVFNVGASLRY